MRVGYGLIAGSLVLAWAVASSSAQAPKQIDPGQIKPVVAPATVSDLRVRPTDGARLSTPVTTVKTLTADECKNLGGEVKDDPWKVCASGKVCNRTDNFGKVHNFCLAASS